jgi:hypothetical protein
MIALKIPKTLSHSAKSKTQGSPWALQESLVCKPYDPNAKPNKNGQGSH